MWFTRLPMSTPCGSGSKVVEVPTLSELQILDHDRRTSSGCRGDVGLKTRRHRPISTIYQLVKPRAGVDFSILLGWVFWGRISGQGVFRSEIDNSGRVLSRSSRVRGVNFTIYNLHVNLRKITVKRIGALHRRRPLYMGRCDVVARNFPFSSHYGCMVPLFELTTTIALCVQPSWRHARLSSPA